MIVYVGEIREIASVASRFDKAMPSHAFKQLNIPMNAPTYLLGQSIVIHR